MKINLCKYDAVIFDMDGVLVDSEPLWKIAMHEVFSSLGSTLEKKDFQKTVGLRIDEVIFYWKNIENWKPSVIEIEEQIINKMISLINAQATPLIGVIDTLDYLSGRLPIAVASSSPFRLINAVLNKLDILHYFKVVHSAEEEDFGKPHPAVFISAARKMGKTPEKCLVIEDSLTGVVAGKAAKMDVVAIPEKTHFPNTRINLADYLFEDMGLFLEKLRSES